MEASGYSQGMEIPLTVRKGEGGNLSYGIPLWYRLASGAMLAVVAGGVLVSESPPSVIAWLIAILLLLGILYEERWTAIPGRKVMRHTEGLLPLTRSFEIPFDEIADLRLEAFAKGTVPGSAEEKADGRRAFAMMKGADIATEARSEARPSLFRMNGRKPYMNLMLATQKGEVLLVDSLPARRAVRLLRAGTALAEACGVPMREYGAQEEEGI